MTKTFNILQKVRKSWEMEETALIWRWLPAFPCGKACAAAPAEPRNDKSGNLPLPEGRRDKLACASHPSLRGGRRPTRQSQVGTFDFAGAFPCSGRYCEIAAPCSARLAMTNLGAFPIRRGAAPSLRVPPSRVIAKRAKPDVAISSRHLRFRRSPAVPALTAVYRITKPGHTLRRVPVLCAYCSAYFFV